VNASEAAQRVTVQTRTETDDGHGGFTVTWADLPPRRRAARVKPLAGRDLERAQAVDPRISHEIGLFYWRSYRTDLVGGRAQLVYHPTSDADDDRTFEIVTPPIDVDERHADLLMLCREAA
jgi:head-tail adaptor